MGDSLWGVALFSTSKDAVSAVDSFTQKIDKILLGPSDRQVLENLCFIFGLRLGSFFLLF